MTRAELLRKYRSEVNKAFADKTRSESRNEILKQVYHAYLDKLLVMKREGKLSEKDYTWITESMIYFNDKCRVHC